MHPGMWIVMRSEAGSVNLGTRILVCGFWCIQKQEVLILALLPYCVGPAAFRDWKYNYWHNCPSACMPRHCNRGTQTETSDASVCCVHMQLLWQGTAWSSLDSYMGRYPEQCISKHTTSAYWALRNGKTGVSTSQCRKAVAIQWSAVSSLFCCCWTDPWAEHSNRVRLALCAPALLRPWLLLLHCWSDTRLPVKGDGGQN